MAYYNGWEVAIAGRLTHSLCSGALPNVCEIFQGIARNTPLVEQFIGDLIFIESFSHSAEELCIWPNLCDISSGGSNSLVGLLSLVASKLEQVALLDIDVKMASVGFTQMHLIVTCTFGCRTICVPTIVPALR